MSTYPFQATASTDAAGPSWTGGTTFSFPGSCFDPYPVVMWSCEPWDLDVDMEMSMSVEDNQPLDETETVGFDPKSQGGWVFYHTYSFSLPREGWRATALQAISTVEWSSLGPTQSDDKSAYDQTSFDSNGQENDPAGEPGGGSNCHDEIWTIYLHGEVWWTGTVQVCEYN